MEAEILKIAAELLECDPGAVDLDAPLLQQEKWSSLLHLVFISRVEEAFSTEIPMEMIPDIKTLRELLEYLGDRGQDR